MWNFVITLLPSLSLVIPPLPGGGGGYTVLSLSVLPSVQDIFFNIFIISSETTGSVETQISRYYVCEVLYNNVSFCLEQAKRHGYLKQFLFQMCWTFKIFSSETSSWNDLLVSKITVFEISPLIYCMLLLYEEASIIKSWSKMYIQQNVSFPP
jgi:hypothetical protein